MLTRVNAPADRPSSETIGSFRMGAVIGRARGSRRHRLGAALLTVGAVSAAVLSAGALTSCDRAESRRVAADARDAARQTAAGLDHAAAQAQPAADRVARDAKHGVDALAIAAGRAARKAGARLEDAGERAQQAPPPPPPPPSSN